MIKENFYDDGGLGTQFENYYKSVNTTQISGTGKISNTQLSDFTTQLKRDSEAVGQDEEAAFLAPYVYGWIRNENLPSWYLFSSYGYEVSGGETTYTFTSDEPKNSAVYLMGYRQIGGTADLVNHTARFRWDNGEWKAITTDTTNLRYTLYNRLDNPEWLGMNPIPSNGGLEYCVWTEEENPTEANYHFIERAPFAGTAISSTEDRLNALMGFFNGDSTLDFWFRGSAPAQAEDLVSLRIGDFGTSGIASFTDNDITYYVAITNAIWSVVPTTWYINPPQYATRYMPLCLVESEVANASQLHTGYSPDYYGTDVLYLDTSTHQITGSSSTYMLNGCYPGAYNCEFKDSDISTYQSKVIGNTLLTRTSASSIQLRLVLKPKSLACALGQYLKFTARADRAWVGTDGGQVLEDEVWYPIYTDNYEITGQFVRGDDPDFASKVADWQVGNLCDNELKKSDIPQDTPTPPFPPGPDDPEDPDSDPTSEADTGSIGYNSVVPAIGGLSFFMKSYVLNVPQLNTIGFDLWSKANSAQTRDLVYKNFSNVKFNADHELLYAEILDYFVSLKWFPFSLKNNCEVINSGEKGIRVGTGYTQIGVNDNLDYNTYFIQNPICYLDGGEVVVPYTYESYMDMEPLTSVSIYIPYCGTQELQPSLVMGRKLKLTYCVDLNTGGCTAIVMGLGQTGDDPAHTSNFQMPICVAHGIVGFEIPMTGNTQNAQTRNALQARDNYYLGQWQVVSGAVQNSILNKGSFNDISSPSSKDEGFLENTKNQFNMLKDYLENPAQSTFFAQRALNNWGTRKGPGQLGDAMAIANIPSQIATGFRAGLNIGTTVKQLQLNKEVYSHQVPYACGTTPLVVGSNSNFSSLILPQKAFIQVRRRNRVKASNYHMTNGYVEMRTHRLGDLQGFTTCINPKLDIKAMPQELAEIYAQLQSGVYIGS